MPGPLIFVVRLLSLIAVIICISLLFGTSPPPEAVIIIGGVLVGIAALWAKAERQRADYKNQFQLGKSRGISSDSQPEKLISRTEKIVEHRRYIEKEQKSNFVTIIMVIAALCSIVAFLRSCIS